MHTSCSCTSRRCRLKRVNISSVTVSTISAGNISYQMGIAPATSLGQNVVMATAGSGVTTAGGTEEASRKRELRLLKNRSEFIYYIWIF